MTTRSLTIIQINDTHGYLEPHPELVWTEAGPSYPQMGGFAHIAAMVSNIREERGGGVLLLDNGDTFHGTYPAVTSKGLALVPIVNALRVDAMTAHWEFAWGPEHFMALAKQLDHPMLALNCYALHTGARPFAGSLLVERAGVKVGVIGLAATIIDKSMPPHFSRGYRFTSGIEELPDEIAALKGQGADVIVLLSHQGFPQDVAIAQSVEGLDVIVSGHTHNRLEEPVKIGTTLIIQSGCHGSYVGRLDLDVDDTGITDWQHRLIPVTAGTQPAPAMAELIETVMAPLRATLDVVIGQTALAMHRGTTLDAPMDDVLLAAIAEAAGTGIALSNGWRYGAPIRPGPVTENDLWNIIPTNPPVSTVELSGAEIHSIMEDSLESTFSADPFGQMGGYLKRFRGLTVLGKLENPKGTRVVAIYAEDGPLLMDHRYTVAFVTAQGVPDKFGEHRRDLNIQAIDALRRYVSRGVPKVIPNAGRFLAV